MWAGMFRHDISDQGPHGHLDPFHRIENHETQLPVEDVEIQHLIEAGVVAEFMGLTSPLDLVGNRVRREAVVTDVPEIPLCPGSIRDDQPAVRPQLKQLLTGQRRLRKGLCSARTGHPVPSHH